MFGVTKQETMAVKCQADAVPRPTVYRWAFNASSAEIIDLPALKYLQVRAAVFFGFAISSQAIGLMTARALYIHTIFKEQLLLQDLQPSLLVGRYQVTR